MEKLIVFSAFFCFNLVSSQNSKVSVPKVEITFIDGTKKHGFGYVKNDSKIVYRKNRNYKKTIYDYTKVLKVTSKYNTVVRHLEYKIVKDGAKEKLMLLETGIDGKVKMYYNYKAPIFKAHNEGFVYVPMTNGGFSNPHYFKPYGGTNDYGPGRIRYYLAKKDSKFVERMKHTNNIYHKKFKVVFKKYFSDCEKLKIKYEGKDFHKEDFEALINFYNNRCNFNSEKTD